jgi:aryl-alcohol dehydrogenase-like predicted oxidoreductase
VMPTLKHLGIGLVAYSPLGRGFLTGALRTRSDLQPTDWRLSTPRFSEQAMAENQRLADLVAQVAEEVQASPAQVALAWLLSRSTANGVSLAAIPGTRKIERLEENFAAQQVSLSQHQLDRLESLITLGVTGDRY